MNRAARIVGWTLLITFASTFAVETGFLAMASAKRVQAAGVELPLDVKLTTYTWLAVGVPADVAYNVTRGTIMFREFPQELLFSHRVERLSKNGGWRGEKAREWKAILNAADPGHIDD